MKPLHTRLWHSLVLLLAVMMLTACTAGDVIFTEETPAGFWYGLWHGMISVITLIVHIFVDTVQVYEVNNTGGWYDAGFLLGVILVWSGSSHVSCKSAERKRRDKEWDEVGKKVERKIMRNLKAWAETEEGGETSLKEWEEIGEKVEKKLKRLIREWAEKE
ncbi:MAG: hypothetical protein R3302_06345 [Sulfurimonadaceae bacterium]|nr:hypothetical protein [Sulfurimonadaceae bacterium]